MANKKQPFRQTVTTGDDVYLVRYHLTPWKFWPFKTRAMLHVFHRPDAGDVLHDHPFDFRAIILWGGYDQIVSVWDNVSFVFKEELRRHGIFSTYRAGFGYRHRIARLHGRRTVTLVLRGPKVRDWGFYPKGAFVLWTRFLGLPDKQRSAYA